MSLDIRDYREELKIIQGLRPNTIICDGASYTRIKEAILADLDDLIRRLQLIQSENYIGDHSINLIKRSQRKLPQKLG